MNSVELSVVIPVYNGGEFLESTIESVLEMSLGHSVECIVIDDGSTDQTSIVIQSFGQKIRSFRQKNSGEGAAVNRGLEMAAGRYAMVVSADDPVATSALFEGVEDFFEQNSDVVAWYPDWNMIDARGNVLKQVLLPEFDFTDLFARNKVLPGPGTWFRVDHALSIGGRRTKWKYVGDYDFWLRLSQSGKLVHRKSVLAQWRRHEGSTSISDRGYFMAKERIEVIEDFIDQFKIHLDPGLISLSRAHANYLAARLGFFSRDVNSRKLFFDALRADIRVLGSAKPHEIIFMALFPLSKISVDAISRLWRSNEK